MECGASLPVAPSQRLYAGARGRPRSAQCLDTVTHKQCVGGGVRDRQKKGAGLGGPNLMSRCVCVGNSYQVWVHSCLGGTEVSGGQGQKEQGRLSIGRGFQKAFL